MERTKAPKGFWKEVRHLDRELFALSDLHWYWQLPGAVKAEAFWRGEDDVDQFVSWSGLWLLGATCTGAQLAVVDNTPKPDDTRYITHNHHFVYSADWPWPPKLDEYHLMTQIEDMTDPASIVRSVSEAVRSRKEQRQLGLSTPQLETYDAFIHELRRGASGEFAISPE